MRPLAMMILAVPVLWLSACASTMPRVPIPHGDDGAMLLCIQTSDSLECVTEKDGHTQHYSIPTAPPDDDDDGWDGSVFKTPPPKDNGT